MRIDSGPVVPPWMTDPEPDTWVPLWVAARLYFRKTYGRVWNMLSDGTLEEVGFKPFKFGGLWYVKLPCPIPPATYPRRSHYKG